MATVTPDLSRGPVLLSISIGTASFAFSTTIVRFCVRMRISNSTGADDYAIAVGTLVALAGTIFSVLESSTPDPSRALELDVLGQPWFMMGATLSKISICLFFIRLLGSSRHWRILLGALIILMAVVNLTFALTVNLQCRPLEKLWIPTTEGECWNPNVQLNFGYFQSAISVFTWLFLSLFPVMIVRDIDMQGHLRWPFYILSTISLVVGLLATVRAYETSRIGGLSVYTADTFLACLLSIIEQNAGIVAANVLPMGPLFSRRARRAVGVGSSRTKTINSSGDRTHVSMGNTSRASSQGPLGESRASSSHSRASTPGHSRASSIQSRVSNYLRGRRSSLDLSQQDERQQQQPRGPTPAPLDGLRKVSFDTTPDDWPDEEDGGDDGNSRGRSRTRGRSRSRSRSGGDEEYELESQSARSGRSSFETDEFWPNGIIKTVSVEVVEEENPYVPEGSRASSASDINVEQDWETMLRTGPDRS